MIELEPPIRAEYERFLKELPEESDAARASGLSAQDVLKAHFLIANYFYDEEKGLGGIGPKSTSLLLSAVDRQFVSFSGVPKWTDRFDICATLFYGLIKNHPFHDANKRTAFLSVLFLLYRYDWCPSVPEKEFEDFTVEISEDGLTKYARYRELVKENHPDPHVKFISWYLRKNTRRIDRYQYSVTFRELKKILNKHGFDLKNEHRNYIDVVSIEEKKKLFGFMGTQTVERRVCQIGFPRWSVEVSKAALKTVREATGLSAKDGVDSAAFFKGVDPMQSLIATYNRPLMSLANR